MQIRNISCVSLLVSLMTATLMTGCLETRPSLKEEQEKQVLHKQVQSLQQTTADENARFQDVDDEIRKVTGRVEALEVKNQQSGTRAEKASSATDAKLKENDAVYREEFTKLQSQIDELKGQLTALLEQAKHNASAQAAANAQLSAAEKKNPYAAAEEKFDAKSWKEAILDYQAYRKANPKGKNFADATYKIGVCFQELGMNDEAKAFFEEVTSKFAKSKEAGRATKRLKAMKKK